jgi:hypothetical protein
LDVVFQTRQGNHAYQQRDGRDSPRTPMQVTRAARGAWDRVHG